MAELSMAELPHGRLAFYGTAELEMAELAWHPINPSSCCPASDGAWGGVQLHFWHNAHSPSFILQKFKVFFALNQLVPIHKFHFAFCII
jgi:hypothetical protein